MDSFDFSVRCSRCSQLLSAMHLNFGGSPIFIKNYSQIFDLRVYDNERFLKMKFVYIFL